MRNIYDVFNNVKPIDTDPATDTLSSSEATALIRRIGVHKKKSKLNWVAACIAGAIILTGTTAYAYNHEIIQDWILARNSGNVEEEYIDYDFINKTYDGNVEIASNLTSSDVSFEVLQAKVTDKTVFTAILVTYNDFDCEKYADYSVSFYCNGSNNAFGSQLGPDVYANLNLANNQRIFCDQFYFSDTSSIMKAGKIELKATDLFAFIHIEENQTDVTHTMEQVDYGYWNLTIPITEYSDLKYAVLPDDSPYQEIYISNMSVHMIKTEGLNDYLKPVHIKITMNDGKTLDNADIGGGGCGDLNQLVYYWEFRVPIDIEKVKSIEIDGQTFEFIK
ncbi:MAG: hypothetical protein IKL53_06945 [Lachnospiraceae bacterium]|nr:hypothetical protein [Lachnospiraceae bacterium]